ncbi:mechanosensitive ion channel domain-containing protein [Rhizobium alvei]|uniref:Mechanosensitive ion channel n=1 Tax=Rhizobium alvei TaxID=1132659 RepID=A0ABT8YIS3_9HYPH|nr:mechanosensitive ion channel domain-containing protein [Rhizobium alvei]MDO6963337.1 mechanosensitive ion channel [Rhizobium alvei]
MTAIASLSRFFAHLFLVAALFATAPAASGQETLTAPAVEDNSRNAIIAAVEKLQEEVKAILAQAANTLTELEKKVQEAAEADNTLAELKLKVESVNSDILSAMADLEKRYNLVSKRLEELGAAAPEGQEEDPGVAADRKRLQGEKAQMNTILADADVVKGEAGRIATEISDRRRQLFAEMLFRQTPITPDVVTNAWTAAQTETSELLMKSKSALEFMWNFKRGALAIAIVLSLLAALVFVMPVQMLFGPYVRRGSEIPNPTYLKRLSLAFLSTLVPAAAVTAFIFTSMVIIVYQSVVRIDLIQIVVSFLWMLAGVYFVYKLARAIFAPTKPQWRLVTVSDRGARLLVWYAVVLALINGMSYVFGATNQALDAPVVLTVAKGFVSTILIGFVLILLSFVRPMQAKELGEGDGSWPAVIRVGLVLTGLGLIVTALAGYIGLAQFVATQIIVTGAIAVTMYIGFLSGHALSSKDAFAETALGKFLARRYGLSAVRLDQIGLVSGLLTYLAVIFFGLPLILLEWGFRFSDIWSIFVQMFTEIRIGSISISLVGIFAGILMFLVGLVATRWLQRWLDGNVLARSEVDSGVRNSVNTAFGYLGVALAGVLGISAAGIDLSNLALVAGALSLGIGFGMQTIVSNFVSGLILLAERPFKVGDWVVTGTVEGFVRRISVRATEIETFQNQSIIVPNAQLINASVGNWTHRNKLGRVEIPIGVSYDSDPRHVMDILLEIANAHPRVMTAPEPSVAFLRFGDSSLDFELRFYIADILAGLGIRNDIRIAIFERFKAEGISIPFLQRDLNVHFTDGAPALRQALEEQGISLAHGKMKEQRDQRRKAMETSVRDMDALDDDQHSHAREPDEADDDDNRG